MTPFFTVLITTYNRPTKLIRAINSVIHQTYTNFEIVIVNDGSINDYKEVEDFIKDYPGIIKYYFKVNEERSIARNYGIEKALGEYICFLDDDDYYLNNHLQVLYNEIKKRNFEKALYHTYSFKIDKNHVKSRMEIINKKPGYSLHEYYITDGLMTMNSTCEHKAILIDCIFPPLLNFAEDHFQRLKAMVKNNVYSIPEYTTIYDQSDETSTTNNSINIPLSYIKSWEAILYEPQIIKHIRKPFRKSLLFKQYALLFNYHRNELSNKSFIFYIFKAFQNCLTISNFVFLINNIRWKYQGR